MAEQLPIVAWEIVAASDLADQLMTAAEKAFSGVGGITSEVESVFEGIFEAMRRGNGSPPV